MKFTAKLQSTLPLHDLHMNGVYCSFVSVLLQTMPLPEICNKYCKIFTVLLIATVDSLASQTSTFFCPFLTYKLHLKFSEAVAFIFCIFDVVLGNVILRTMFVWFLGMCMCKLPFY